MINQTKEKTPDDLIISYLHRAENVYCRYLESLEQEPQYLRSFEDGSVQLFVEIAKMIQLQELK